MHARTQGAFWGANVFEGLRGYWREQDGQLSVFRLDDHLARLGRSMKSLHMRPAYTDEEIRQACLELLAANDFVRTPTCAWWPTSAWGPTSKR